jgi:hypothetical protein
MTALVALSTGDSAGRIGCNTVTLLNHYRGWRMKSLADCAEPLIPWDTTGVGYDRHKAAIIERMSTWSVLKALARNEPRHLVSREGVAAMRAYCSLRRQLSGRGIGEPGFRSKLVEDVDPAIRDGVAAIFRETFAEEDPAEYDGMVSRLDALSGWIAQPLGAQVATGPRSVGRRRAATRAPARRGAARPSVSAVADP